jgi:hypothetical protein
MAHISYAHEPLPLSALRQENRKIPLQNRPYFTALPVLSPQVETKIHSDSLTAAESICPAAS